MNLTQSLPQNEHVLGIAERVRKKYPSSKCQCAIMARDLAMALTKAGFRVQHVQGNFHLDEPGASEFADDDDFENADEYAANHDWVEIEGKILDIAADQFRKYVHDKIPDIVFINYSDPLYLHYEQLGYG